jgi:hypothetical protein
MTSSFASQDHVFFHRRHKKVLPTTRSRTFKAVHNQFVRFCQLLFDSFSSFYLIIASIDRVLVTSPSALIRQRSSYSSIFKK